MTVGEFTDVTQWSAVVGFFFPLVAALIKQERFSRAVNSVIALVLAVATGLVTAWAQGDLSWETWATSAIVVYAIAGSTYRSLWQPTGIEPKIQAATSVGSPPATSEV